MRDALRGYLSMANGLTEVPRRRAAAAARALLAQGEATAEQVSQLTDELLATSRSNREALSTLIRYEVDRTLDQMGLVTADKLRALTARVATLEAQTRSAAGGADSRPPSAPAAMHAEPPATNAAAKRAARKAAKKAAKKAVKQAPAKSPLSGEAATKKAPAKKAAKKAGPSRTGAPTEGAAPVGGRS